jgi:hypothetical protein
MGEKTEPAVTFIRLSLNVRPRAAEETAADTAMVKAFKYCEPFRVASQWGYHVFAPFDFWLRSDGRRGIKWSLDAHEWEPLVEKIPGVWADAWDAVAPDNCKGYCPSFLAVGEENRIIQIGTGVVAKTRPGYGLYVRPMVNDAKPPGGYITYEGFIDTDTWWHPLFANIEITQTNEPIRIARDWPLLQVYPVPHELIRAKHDYKVTEEIPAEAWDFYHSDIIQNVMRIDHTRGHYAAASRKRNR